MLLALGALCPTLPAPVQDDVTGSHEEFAVAVAVCDDRNGDGVGDLVVGSPSSGTGGEVLLFSSSTGTEISRWGCPSGYRDHGRFLHVMDDWDGDSVRDVAVAAIEAQSGAPVVVVRSLGTGRFLSIRTLPHGFNVCGIDSLPDTDGDGKRELLVTALAKPRSASWAEARLRGVVLGSAGATVLGPDLGTSEYLGTRQPTTHVVGNAAFLAVGDTLRVLSPSCDEIREIGSAVRERTAVIVDFVPCGDRDGDGVEDLFLSYEPVRPPGGDAAAMLVSGADGRVLRDVEDDLAGRRMFFAVESVADVDGDGVSDWIASRYSAFECALFEISGGTGRSIRRQSVRETLPMFGWRLQTIGDVDGDGVEDILGTRYSPGVLGSEEQGFTVLSGSSLDELYSVTVEDLAAMEALPGSYLLRFQSAYAHMENGDLARAIAGFETCFRLSPESSTVAYYLACACARLGDQGRALAWLETATDRGFADAHLLAWEPDLRPLRGRPRFVECVERCSAVPGAQPQDLEILVGGPGRYEVVDLEERAGWIGVRGPEGTRVVGSTGELVLELEGPGRIDRLLLPARGGRIFGVVETDTGGTWVRRWTEKGELLHPAFGFGCDDLAVSADGRRVITVERTGFRAGFYDGETGELLTDYFERARDGERDTVGFVGTRYAYFHDSRRRLFVLDAETGKTLRILPPEPGRPARSFCVDPQNGTLLVGCAGRVRWWRPEGEQPLRELETDTAVAPRMRVVPRVGVLLTGSYRDPLTAWDIERGQRLWSVSVPANRWRVEEESSVVVPSHDGGYRVLDALSGSVLDEVPSPWPWPARPSAVVPLADGKTVAWLTADARVTLVDVGTGRRLHEVGDPSERPERIEATTDGEWLLLQRSDGTSVVELASGATTARVAHGGGAFLSPDGTSLAVPRDGALQLLDVPSLAPRAYLGDGEALQLAAWSADGLRVAAMDPGGRVAVFDGRTGDELARIPPESGPITLAVLAHDGRLLLTSEGGSRARLWIAGTGEWLRDLDHGDGLGGKVLGAAFDPEGERVVTATWDWTDLRAFEVDTGRRLWTVAPIISEWSELRVDEGRVYAGCAGVFDVETGECVFENVDIESTARIPGQRLVVATDSRGMVLLDADSFAQRYSRTELEDAGEIVWLPSALHHGSGEILRRVPLRVGADVYPLDSFAPFLYDPRRVSAAAAGVELREPVLPQPPSISLSSTQPRRVRVAGGETTVRVTAHAAGGVLDFQLERDGATLPVDFPEKRVTLGDTVARLAWTVRGPGNGETALRIRAIGRSGASSRPVLVRLSFDD